MRATWRRLSASHSELPFRPHPHLGGSPRSLGGGEAFATRALALAPDHPLGHMCLGLPYVFNYRAMQGIAQCERALALDRNLAVAHAYIGMAKWFVGRGEETQGHIDEAFRLSPRDTLAYFWRALAGIAKSSLASMKRPPQACVTQLKSMEILPCITSTSRLRLAELGQLDEARIAAQKGLAIDPRFTILLYRNSTPSDNPTFLKARERIYVAMRKAGVPEG